jgi:hypothetical protein
MAVCTAIPVHLPFLKKLIDFAVFWQDIPKRIRKLARRVGRIVRLASSFMMFSTPRSERGPIIAQ